MSIAAKCTCGDSLYYCTGGNNCTNGHKYGVTLPAYNDEGQGEYNDLWTEVINKVESDNGDVRLYADTISWLQERFNITRKQPNQDTKNK